MSEFEQAIGRKAYPSDFADITAVVGDAKRVITETDGMGIHPIMNPNRIPWWEQHMMGAKNEEEAREMIKRDEEALLLRQTALQLARRINDLEKMEKEEAKKVGKK
jgi:hypothetical protein